MYVLIVKNISALRAEFRRMCRILRLPRSSYYKERSEVDEEKDRRGKDEEFSGRCDIVLAE